MAISNLQNFYKVKLTKACSAGATNIYVTTKPTPVNGFLVISPKSESLREVIKYTGTGTDGDGDYVTVLNVSDRGLGGTTAQAHEVGESVRMNYTAEHQKEIDDTIAAIVAAGAPDASTTVKGIARLSTAPVDPTIPIAVGTNDARLNATTGLTTDKENALAGGGAFGTPSSTNKFVTEDFQVDYINTLLQGTSPVVESTASGVDNTATQTNIVTMPSGIVAGDLLIVFFSNFTSVDSTASGWTRISQSGSSFSHVFAKIAAGGDTCTVVTGQNQVSAWASYRISGWKNPGDLSQIKINEVSGDTSPIITPFEIAKNCLWLSCRTHTGTGTYTAVPTNYSGLVTATSTGSGASVGTASRSAVLFNEMPGTFTTSGTRNNIRSYVLAIRPSNT
jgi:hypothetical protein